MADRPTRGWRRSQFVLCLGVAVALTACGGNASSGSPTPLATAGFVAVSGGAAGGISPAGIAIRFVADGSFGIAFALRNGTDESVTVTTVHTAEPTHSLVRQTGTRLGPWSQPRCPRGALGCPIRSFLNAPYGPAKPTPVTISAGKMVGVQLNYKLVGCGDAGTSSTSSARLLEISYRYGNGAIRSEELPVAAIQLRLQRPTANECLEPHSRIVIEGPYATTSASAVAGGYGVFGGDTCTQTPGDGLEFQSAPFQSGRDGRPQLTVHFLIPHLTHVGIYRSPAAAAALGVARIDVTTNMSGESTFPPRESIVTVTRANATALAGRLDAVVTAYRTSFRLHGTWHCTTRP